VKNDIAVHAWNREHRVDWDSARVVALAPYTWERCVTEALHICYIASPNIELKTVASIATPYGTPSSETINPLSTPDHS